MVDIAAQLSLTVSGPAIDPAVILGAETADSQAFGDILAGQVAGSLGANGESGAPAAPLPPSPLPAGNRQPSGKILPGAAQILPDAAPLGVEAPAAQVLPSIAAIPVVRLVTTASLANLALKAGPATSLSSDAATDAPEPKQIEASPVHGLIKMLSAALKGQRPVAASVAEEAPVASETLDPETASAEPTTPEQAVPTATPTVVLSAALPIPPALAATPQAAASDAPRAASGGAAPIPAQAPILISNRVSASTQILPQQMHAVLHEQVRPAFAQSSAPPLETGPITAPSGQVQPQARQVQTQVIQAQFLPAPAVQLQPAPIPAGTQVEVPAAPVLTVAAAVGQTPVPAVALVTAPARPLGQTVAARIKIAAPAPAQDGPAVTAALPVSASPRLAARDGTAEGPVVASRAAPAIRTVLAERGTADLAPAPVTGDSPASLAAAQVTSAPLTPTASNGAPVVEMPRQDFAALVDRLVEARNASVPQSTHASLNHAEFGQVSLHFEQDGGDLKVAMSSADPDFARAAQAAQTAHAAIPAERQNVTADAGSRGQSQNQSPSANSSSHSHQEAAGRGTERSDQQSRNGPDRHSRGGYSSSNPSQRRGGGDQPQTRGGIFA